MATDSKPGEYADPKQTQNLDAGGVSIEHEGNTITLTKETSEDATVDIKVSTPDGHVLQRQCVWNGSSWDCN